MKLQKNFTVIRQAKNYYDIHKFFVIFSILVLILNSACNSDITDLNTGTYYNSNTVQRWNLKGNVKSISPYNNDLVFEFNREGLVIKVTYNQSEFIHVKEYNYDTSGRLQDIVSYFQNDPDGKNTESYTYDNTNRFVLKEPSCLVTNFSEFNNSQVVNDLVLGLKTIKGPGLDYNYSFVDDTLYLSQKMTINDTLINNTTKVIYNGKYPVRYNILDSFSNTNTTYKDIVFSILGNLLHFSEEISDDKSSINKRKFYYKPDYPSMLLDSIIYEYGVSRTVEKFIYNSKMDLQQHTWGNITWEYDYTYDSHGNWIKQVEKSKSNDSASWGNALTTTRVIKYW